VKVHFTPRARRRALTVAAWWRQNRPGAPDLFERELEWAKQRLETEPQVGLVYETIRGRTVRRVLLPKSEQHVYYSVDDEGQTVTVLNVWGARRGRAPRL
jgi:plasmid stabilization system protein ParE